MSSNMRLDDNQIQVYSSFIKISKIREQLLNNFFESLDLILDEYNLKGISDLNYILNEITEYRDVLKNESVTINPVYSEAWEKMLENNPIEKGEECQEITLNICKYFNFCKYCRSKAGLDKIEQYDECNWCKICTIYRSEELKTIKSNAKKNYKKYIEKKLDNNIINLTENTPITNRTSINILTPSVVINNIINSYTPGIEDPLLTVNTNEINEYSSSIALDNVDQPLPRITDIPLASAQYISTKDHYFNVNITFSSKNDKILEKIKYIFTYLMCGKKGKELFPDEPKHSLSKTFPLLAGLYTIKYVNNHPTLYGLLRYKHIINQSALSINKMKKLGMCKDIRNSPIIKVTIPLLWEDNKHCYCATNMKTIVDNIISTPYYGSEISLFFNNDNIIKIL